MAIIWTAVGLGLFFAWWTVAKNLTSEEVNTHANKLAQELQIPWQLNFSKVIPRFGGDFRLVLRGITATNLKGEKILTGQTAEIRMPWTLFFTKNSAQVNVSVEGIKVTDWRELLLEVERWLDARKRDSTQEISMPPHVIASRFNLRLTNIEGPLDGSTRRLDKFFLLNVKPRSPSAFEIVLPWSLEWQNASISGQTKILGEYKISQEKIDLHYYLKNKLQVARGNNIRSGESSIEGKGFYHPRMGFFSTLSSKDDWLGMVGDVEWTSEHIKIDVPRFAISHEFLLDILPFDALRTGSGPYQGTGVGGSLSWKRTKVSKKFSIDLKTKSNVRINRQDGPGKLQINAKWGEGINASAEINISEKPFFSFSHDSKGSVLNWSHELFLPKTGDANWLEPDASVWDLLSWLPWKEVAVNTEIRPSYRIERIGESIKVYDYTPWDGGPRMTLVYPILSEKVNEWVAAFSGLSIEKLFSLAEVESPVVPGFAFSGGMQSKPNQHLGLKLSWKGPPIALLSRSSCKLVIQDNPEIASFLNETFAHQADVSYENQTYKINKWMMKSPAVDWVAKGEWSNQPIKCSLELIESQRKKKSKSHFVNLN